MRLVIHTEGNVFFVAGYISRSILKNTKCQHCPELLAKSKSAPQIEVAEDSTAAEDFLRSINRGGLVTPSDLVFLVCIHALQLRDELFDSGKIQEQFLATLNPQSVFVGLL